jgi:hypothetical protein
MISPDEVADPERSFTRLLFAGQDMAECSGAINFLMERSELAGIVPAGTRDRRGGRLRASVDERQHRGIGRSLATTRARTTRAARRTHEGSKRLPSGRSSDDYPGIVNQIEKRVEPCQTYKWDDFADNAWSMCVMDGVVEHFCVYKIPGDWEAYEQGLHVGHRVHGEADARVVEVRGMKTGE